MTENNNPKKESLSNETKKYSKKNLQLLAVIIGMLVLIGGMYYFHLATIKKTEQSVDENYSMSNSSPVDNKLLPVSPPPDKTVQEKNSVSSQAQLELIQTKQKELQQRLAAPLMIVNNNLTDNNSKKILAEPQLTNDRNTQFMNQVSAANPAAATMSIIGPLNLVIAEGSFIHATLESASNSDLPGFLRASVSEPVYAEDGSQVLIPSGSRLIGQYKSGMMQGQSRIFVVWTRLITPTGISINLGSPGVDSLGVAGMGADSIDRHFWERFGTASLLSLIGAGTANVGVTSTDQNNSAASYRSAVANSFSQSADQSLQQDGQIPPTLTKYQGEPIMVFVAKDLNFQAVMHQAHSNTNVF